MNGKRWKRLKGILLLGTVLAALKMIFFDYTLDEEYQIVMAYRNISVDSWFVQMWEPHQTSAFLCAWLMRLYYVAAGTYTGVILYLRICTTLIQLALTFYLYRVLCGLTEKRYAFMLALIYFNVVPKAIQIPEFSNMQLWFFTLLVLLLIRYYKGTGDQKRRDYILLILMGLCMSLEVLSYPSCIILFPFFSGYIFKKSGSKRWRDTACFAGTCGACALVWLGLILRNISFSDFVRNVGYMLDFDPTHEISGVSSTKLAALFSNLVAGLGLIALILAISGGIFFLLRMCQNKKAAGEHPADEKSNVNENDGGNDSGTGRLYAAQAKRECILKFAVIAIMVSEVVQLFYWVILHTGYELPHIHFAVILFAAGAAWRYAGKQKGAFCGDSRGPAFYRRGGLYQRSGALQCTAAWLAGRPVLCDSHYVGAAKYSGRAGRTLDMGVACQPVSGLSGGKGLYHARRPWL
ncbi:MAG: hypothetical protein LUE16_01535 [Lachnospiraceae bacterium]|nr:hypothetical protein [Lachnospiraceae bacterium]